MEHKTRKVYDNCALHKDTKHIQCHYDLVMNVMIKQNCLMCFILNGRPDDYYVRH